MASVSMPDSDELTYLIQDLLAPPSSQQLRESVLGGCARLLASTNLAPAHVSLLVSHIASSPCLWSSAQSSAQPHSIQLQASKQVFDAVRAGVFHRARAISRLHTKQGSSSSFSAPSTPSWRSRRDYRAFIDAFVEPLAPRTAAAASKKSDDAEVVHPVVRLTLLSASLSALQVIQSQQQGSSGRGAAQQARDAVSFFVGGALVQGVLERACMDSWAAYFTSRSQSAATGETELWLAAQCLPGITFDELKRSHVLPSLVRALATDAWPDALAHGHALDDAVASSSPSSSSVTTPSLDDVVSAPLYEALAPLSRSLGRTMEACKPQRHCSTASMPYDEQEAACAILQAVETIERVSCRLVEAWAAAAARDRNNDATDGRREKAWGLLKTTLFSVVLVHSSTLVVVAPPAEASTSRATSSVNASASSMRARIADHALRALASLSLVNASLAASSGGNGGLQAWPALVAGLLDVVRLEQDEQGVNSGTQARVLVRALEPLPRDGSIWATRPSWSESELERARVAFWLASIEQLMEHMPDDYLECIVLPALRPYLERNDDKDAFESAHSVVLAALAAGKQCGAGIVPWYTDFLLSSHATLLTAAQLRLAFGTMVRYASSYDDASCGGRAGRATTADGGDDGLAWYCVSRLREALEPSDSDDKTEEGSSHVADWVRARQAALRGDDHPHEASASRQDDASGDSTTHTLMNEAGPLSERERRVLAAWGRRRGAIALAFVDQLTHVNLGLVPALLEVIDKLVPAAPPHLPEEAKRLGDDDNHHAATRATTPRPNLDVKTTTRSREDNDQRSEAQRSSEEAGVNSNKLAAESQKLRSSSLLGVVFATIAGDGSSPLDATKRELATRWWLSRGVTLHTRL